MLPAASTLLEALDRFPHQRREDRLTEVFAHVLATVPSLARWFILEADAPHVPADDAQPEFFTQGALAGAGRPDMICRYQVADTPEWRKILSEHKIDAEFTDYQREGYANWDRDANVLVAPAEHSLPVW